MVGDYIGGLSAQLGLQQQALANQYGQYITSGYLNTSGYSAGSLYADSTANTTITIYPGGNVASAEPDDDGEESALEWLDRRVAEVCVEL